MIKSAPNIDTPPFLFRNEIIIMRDMKKFKEQLKQQAKQLGFTSIGITNAEYLQSASKNLIKYLEEGRHGTMDWLARTEKERADPKAFFPEAKSVLMTAHNYYRADEKMLSSPEAGSISNYARGRDYHKVVRKKLKTLLNWIIQEIPETKGRVFVDSFPIMEKPLAMKAGIGWIAKNTTLIIKGKGSYYFLGGILLNLELPQDEPLTNEFCGKCTRCMQACPTDAITAPFQLDSNRCISYLTIEHHGQIDEIYHSKMGNYIFGCDICQMVCPWNRQFASRTQETDFFSRFSENDLLLARLSSLSKEEFEKMFEGTPVRRAGYENFLRNVQIAKKNIRNSDDINTR